MNKTEEENTKLKDKGANSPVGEQALAHLQAESSKNSLKIAYVIPRFHPFKGGAEQNIEAMAVRMAAIGHEVSVFTTDVKFRDEELSVVENYKGVKIIRHRAWNKALNLGFWPGLLGSLRKNDFDVIHSSGFGFIWVEFCLFWKRWRSRKRKTKFINTPHGPFLASAEEGSMKERIKKFYDRILKFYLPKLYDQCIAVVPSQQEWITKVYGFKDQDITVVKNGIDPEYIEKELPAYKKEDKIIITFLNRMAWYKGIQDVITALGRLQKNSLDLSNVQFKVMGARTKYTDTLMRLAKDNKLEKTVEFIYTPTDSERDQAFLDSQINILPSKWEATGIVLLEAMAKGNAIVTTNQNQAAEFLITEESGFAYDFGDVEELMIILKKLILDYEKRQAMIKHNHEFVKSFSWDAVFPDYRKMVENLVKVKGAY